MKRNFEIMKVDKKFKKILEETRIKRIQNNIDKKLRSFPELTGMIMNTPSIQKVLKEMEEIPKREDIDKWKLGLL